MKLSNWALLGPTCLGLRDAIAREAQHQEAVIRIMTVLPGKYRYEQVEAAMKASGDTPYTLYMAIAANLSYTDEAIKRYINDLDIHSYRSAMALALFYEALGKPSQIARE